jgi:hypothetical protein
MKIFKLVISTIVEVIASPFTLLFRTKAQKNSGNKVNIFLVVLLSLLIVATLLFLAYYERLFA